MPAFVNLQQYYLEKCLVDARGGVQASSCAGATAWPALAPRNDGVRLTIETPDGAYVLTPTG